MRRVALSLSAAAVAIASASACGDGVRSVPQTREPFRVAGAQFFEGDIPKGGAGPKIVEVDIANRFLPQGATGHKFSGSAEPSARAIAMRLADAGSGYWVFPVSLVDPQTNDLGWEASIEIAQTLPTGAHTLEIAAIDERGVFGAREDDIELDVQSLTPAGRVVVSLAWDSAADLDLRVTGPDGKTTSPKHPSTGIATDGGVDATSSGVGVLDRDSNASCVQDGLRREDLVFTDAPAPGRYVVRVGEFDACGAAATNLTLTLYVDGAVKAVVPARVLDLDADGGASTGVFVAEWSL